MRAIQRSLKTASRTGERPTPKSGSKLQEKGLLTARSPFGRIALRLLFSTKCPMGGGGLAEVHRQRAARTPWDDVGLSRVSPLEC